MSKKIAEGVGALVLDVKVGSRRVHEGPRTTRAKLARTMVGLGTDAGVRHRRAAHRDGHPARPDRRQRARGRRGGRGAGRRWSRRRRRADARAGPRDARRRRAGRRRPRRQARRRLRDGRLAAMIRAQGGDPDAALPQAKEPHVVAAPASGTLTRLDAMAVGLAAWRLGAGRARKEDPVQAGAGVVWMRAPATG